MASPEKLDLPPSSPRIPRVIVVLATGAIVLGTIVALVGAVTVGVTWDEAAHVNILRTYFETGWHTAAPLMGGFPDPAFYFGTYVYGPVGELIPHFVNVALGHEDLWRTVSDSADAYAGRHVGTALQGLIGVGAVGATVGVIARSWRWALLGAAVLSSIPLWTGHSMFNIKDTPPASGYALFTLGLVTLLDSRYFTDRRLRALALVSMTLGLVFAIGVRTGLAALFVVSLPIAVLVLWLAGQREGRSVSRGLRVPRRLLEGIGAFVAAYAILVALYPKAFLNPIEVGIKSLLDSALYPVNEAQLANGIWMTQPVSWSYLPLWFAAQLPLLVIFFGIGFMLWWIVRTVRFVLVIPPADLAPQRALVQPVPLLLQALAAPLAAILGSTTLYNGSRQMLFVVPAIAAMAVLGIWIASRWISSTAKRWTTGALWTVVGIGIVTPLVAQVQLFPYGYTYFNAAAVVRPIDGNWPTDYWRASGRELLRRLPATGPESCGFEQLQKAEFFPCTEQPMFTPFLHERGLFARDHRLAPHEYWFLIENHGFLELPPGCRPHDTITRSLLWRDVTIGQILICDDRIDTGQRNLVDPSMPIT